MPGRDVSSRGGDVDGRGNGGDGGGEDASASGGGGASLGILSVGGGSEAIPRTSDLWGRFGGMVRVWVRLGLGVVYDEDVLPEHHMFAKSSRCPTNLCNTIVCQNGKQL